MIDRTKREYECRCEVSALKDTLVCGESEVRISLDTVLNRLRRMQAFQCVAERGTIDKLVPCLQIGMNDW